MPTDSAVLTNIGPAELARRETAAREETEQIEKSVEEGMVRNLSGYIDTRWADAKQAKITVEMGMIASRDQRRGEYSPKKLSEIRSVNQPEIFMNVTDTKCRNAIAQIKDVVCQPDKRIFAADPSPIPELPADMQEQIEKGVVQRFLDMAVSQARQTGQAIPSDQLRTMMMDQADAIKKKVHQAVTGKAKELSEDLMDKIDDDWLQGGFYKALEQAIDDIVQLKAGIIKGPVFRVDRVRKVIRDPESGRLSSTIEEKIVPQYDRRSPFNIFPSPRSTSIDGGYLFDVISIRPRQLADLRTVDGFKATEIDLVMEEFNGGALRDDWLGLSEDAKDGIGEENEDLRESRPENIYCLEFWDEIPGKLLVDWGMSAGDISDPLTHYPVCVWKIGAHVIKAMLNYSAMGEKPYSKTSFETDNDSFWGSNVPEKIADCQQVCNACARSILSNVGMGALPQVGLNVDRLEPGASRTPWPGRVWPMTEEQMGSTVPPIAWYQPPMVTQQLITVYETFSRIADEHSGVPAFSHGDAAVGGAGNTSSGLAQLRAMSRQGLNAVIRNIDNDIIVTCLTRHYDYLLEHVEVYGLLGDYKLSAKGTSALIEKDQETQRQMEYTNYTANPTDIAIVGVENRRKMLFNVARNLGIELDESILPTPIAQVPGAPTPPAESPATLDAAGNPAQGVDGRQFNPERPRLEASTPGNAGGAV
jgi:hypothetical protein